MDYSSFKQLLCTTFQINSIFAPSEGQIQQFYDLTNHLLDVGSKMNLTALKEIPDIVTKHYADSLLAVDRFPQGANVLDVGCGAGFPSIPLAIMRKDLKITALDSTAKKISFVRSSTELLGLQNICPIVGRAEDAAVRAQIGAFDIVTSRAVARLNILIELCVPFIRLNGKLIALKGAKGEEELAEARQAIRLLGGSASQPVSLNLISETGAQETRAIIEVVKAAETPSQYPRPYAQIIKKPL